MDFIFSLLFVLAIALYFFLFLPQRIETLLQPLREEIYSLRNKVLMLESKLGNGTSTPLSPAQPETPAMDMSDAIDQWADNPDVEQIPEIESRYVPFSSEARTTDDDFFEDEEKVQATPPQIRIQEKVSSSEFNLGAKLPVWIGSISLILSAVFLVKYSIDAGWFSPAVRFVLNLLFGTGLMAIGQFIFKKRSIPNATRVAQGLVGAGIVAMYVGFYSAVNFHHLISPIAGFIGMSIVTLSSIIFSIRHGQPIAIFGLVGGMLTPALINTGEPNATSLFSYLFILTGGMVYTMSRRGWWVLASLTVTAATLWSVIWILSGAAEGSEKIISLFAAGLLGSILFSTRQILSDRIPQTTETRESANFLNLTGIGGTAAIFLFLLNNLTMGYFDLSIAGLTSLAAIALAYFRPGIYRWAVAGKAIVDTLIVGIWMQDASIQSSLIVLSGYSAIYVLLPQLLIEKAENPRYWSILQCSAAIAAYLLGYTMLSLPPEIQATHLWGAIAASLALISAYKASMWRESKIMLAAYAATSTAFLSIGLAIMLDYSWLPIAFAAQALALFWIAEKSDLPVLTKLSHILSAIFVVSEIGQILLFAESILTSLVKEKPFIFDEMALDRPLTQIGIPAILYVIFTLLTFRAKNIAAQARVMSPYISKIAAGLTLMVGYYFLRGLFHPHEKIFAMTAGFMERGTISIAILLASTLLFLIHQKTSQAQIGIAAKIMLYFGLARLTYFDLLISNPFWNNDQYVGDAMILNGVTLIYGAGLIASLYAVRLHSLFKVLTGIFLFALISLTIRQFFHGTSLYNVGEMANAEFYSYSIAWLLTGLTLLAIGIRRDDRSIRIGALAFLTLTIGKVFFFDAAVLQGLMRIFSFLGLGISLIGLSVFYTKFINQSKSSQISKSGDTLHD